jgi:alkylation response protein AidB-like acyl-CoA dehydrogenase
MDLTYGKEYDVFRDEVRTFLDRYWPPSRSGGRPTADEVSEFRDLATAHGFLRRSIPRRYGGAEQPPDVLRGAILREEFRRVRAPMDPSGVGTMMLVPTLLDRGADWQKDKFVLPTMRGEMVWCQGYSEPGAGSDLAAISTRGELVGDEWVINGQKVWTSGAHAADWMFCLVRTEPAAPKHAGISYLLIEMNQPGIEVKPLRQMTGAADFNEVFFTDVRTPKDHIVGERGQGWLVSRTTLKHERNWIGAATQTTKLFDGLVQLARTTSRGGRRNIDDPAVRQRLAEIEGYVRAHEYSSYRQLTKNVKGEDPGIIQQMNKLSSTNIGHRVAAVALDLLGDGGLLDATAIERDGQRPTNERSWITHYMYTLAGAIAGGPANIQRNLIAERGLGLPRDAHLQKDAAR